MSDEQLDDFFRKAAEQYDIPYNPHAWDKMNRQLDQASGKGNFFSRKIIPGLILLLLLAGSVGIGRLYFPHASQTESTLSDTPSASSAIIATDTASSLSKTSLPSQNLVPASSTSPQNTSHAGDTHDGDHPPTPTSTSNLSADKVSTPVSIPVATTGHAATAATNTAIRRVSYRPWIRYPSSLRNIDLRALAPLEITVSSAASASEPTEITPRSRHLSARYGLSLGISPDISSVKIGTTSGVGRKITIQFEYFLSQRWSIATGAMLSHKTYTASGEAYRPYPGYWDRYPLPDNINGQCDVLDLPLNVKFYAVPLDRSRLFISSGLSSYLMLREDYEYVYPGRGSYDRAERNTNRHYFRVVNLSLGYDRPLGKRWALQVEPFVKVPLTGVGFGHIRLTTLGTIFSIHYRGGRHP